MIRARTFVFAIFAVSCAFLPTALFASDADVQSQIDDINSQKAELDAQIAQYQKQLDALGAQHQTLQTSITGLTTQQSQLIAKIKSTQKSIDAANLELGQLGAQIGSTQDAIDVDKRAVAASLRDIAKADDFPIVATLFTSDSLSTLWTAVDADNQLSATLQGHTKTLAEAKEELTSEQKDVSAKHDQLSNLGSSLNTQNKQLTVTKQSKQSLLTQTQNQESQYQALIAQKKAEEAAFEAQLFKLASQLKSVDRSGLPAQGSGVLNWPLASIRITQLFGKTSDSGRLYASGTHNGVDFAAPMSTPVFAVLGGTVLATNEGAVQNCQYGKWILIDHGNGLATLYGHLSYIDVSKGQVVTTGQEIGLSGMTGYATGPHLHLSVFVASAVTIQQYTCKSGYTVTIPNANPSDYLDPMAYLPSL
jgi:murein DD-endopeptidase MepM/ murein hydrolase activator NlpD